MCFSSLVVDDIDISSGEYKCFIVLEIEKKGVFGMHWTEQ
jgi:hypothetical protein